MTPRRRSAREAQRERIPLLSSLMCGAPGPGRGRTALGDLALEHAVPWRPGRRSAREPHGRRAEAAGGAEGIAASQQIRHAATVAALRAGAELLRCLRCAFLPYAVKGCVNLYERVLADPTRERAPWRRRGEASPSGARLRLGSGLVPDRAPEGAARQAHRALRDGDAREREALRRRAALSAPQLRDPRRERLPRPHRARGVRRPRREPRGLHDGLRDARALRLRVHRHVLRDAHRRGRHAHAAADRRS